jgi:UDP-N-acetylmuramate--alanine ligase
MFFRQHRLHFVGIGGIGMSGIAEVLLNSGYEISGSDLRATPVTDRLATLGARILFGHKTENVGAADAVVVTSAVKEDNPEIIEARRRNIPVIPRGEMLAELMRLKFGIAAGGSHGKTTTTSLIATVLSSAGLDPTVIVGGRLATLGGTNARVGASELLVVESDESDGSFLKLAPIFAVITNIDREHLDHYGTFERVLAAFVEFANKVPFYGAAVVCIDDAHVQSILPLIRRRVLTYGVSRQADLRIVDAQYEAASSDFALEHKGQPLGRFRLNVAGAHNVLNAAATAAIGLELNLPADQIRTGLAAYQGVDRRFQLRGKVAGVTVVDDYGHHPTEIRATLDAARLGGHRRVLVLFQPHRYTRTASLLDEFAGAFHQASAVWVTDIYAASEAPLPGVTAEALVRRMRESGHREASFAGSVEAGAEAIAEAAQAGDLIVTLGAGSISRFADTIVERLKVRGAEGTL